MAVLLFATASVWAAVDTDKFYLRGIAASLPNYDTLSATMTPTASAATTRGVTCTQGPSDDLIYSFVGPAVGATSLSSGTWNIMLYGAGSNSNLGSEALKIYVYARTTGGVENLIFQSPNTTAMSHNATVRTYTWSYVMPTVTAVNATDSLEVKVFAAQCCAGTKTAGDTVTLYYDASNRQAYVNSPFDVTPPGPVTNLAAAIPGGSVGTVSLTWSSPGNDGAINALNAGTDFLIKYSTSNSNWNSSSAQTINTLNASMNPNTSTSTTITNLTGGTLYYFALWTQDESNNISALSNIVSATPNQPATPSVVNPPITAVFISSASAQWGNGGNPAGAVYNVLASTVSDFSGSILSTSTTNFSSTVAGLTPGSPYFLEVDAVIGVSSSAYLSLGSTVTIPAASGLSPPNFTAVYITSAAAQWTGNGNPPNSQYALLASTASNFTGTISSATTATGTSIVLPGLNPLTTYYFEVDASTNGRTGAYTNLGSTITLPAPPAALAPAFIMVGVASATVQWSANGNPAAARYAVQASTAPNFSGTLASSVTANTSATLTNLSTNTVYYFQASAQGSGYSSAWVNLGSTQALVSVPTTLAATYAMVGVTSVTVQWSANGNPAGTQYNLQASTASNFTGTLIASNTLNASATVTGLSTNTAYYFQVQSQGPGSVSGFLNLSSTQTLAAAPVTVVPIFQMVSITSATVQWGINGNPAGTQYNVQASTASNFTGTLLTSSTLNASAAVIGLSTNTVYYFQVQSQGTGSVSSFLSLSSTQTLVSIPVLSAPTFQMVGITSATVQWGANGNPAGTQYNLQASTAADFSGTFLASSTLNASATVIGLSTNTVYYFQVQSQGTGSVSSFLSLSSTQTLVSIPVLSAPTFQMVGITSATVQWGANGNPAVTQYNLQASTASNFTGTVVASNTLNSSATLISLSTAAVYYFQVQSQGPGSLSAFLNLSSTQTLVGPPVAVSPVFTMVGVSSMTAQWSSSGDGPGTRYNLQASTAADFTGTLFSSGTANTSATVIGLATSTIYYLQADAVLNGSSSAFLSFGSTITAPTPPLSLSSTFTAVFQSSITVQWNTNGNGPAASFDLQASTASDFSGTLVSTAVAVGSAVLAGLNGGSTYYCRVRALTASMATPFTNLGSTVTLGASANPPGIVLPSLLMTGVSSVTAQWTDGGNPAGTTFILQASTASNFIGTVLSSSTGGSGTVSATVIMLSGDSTYYLRVQAQLQSGSASQFTSLGSTITLPALPALAAPTFISVGSSVVTVQWAANTNSDSTIYDLNASTAADFSGALASSSIYNLQATLTTLGINTTYYFEVRARGNGKASAYLSLGSTTTYPAPPGGNAVSTFTAVYISSVGAQWTANGNGGGVTYNLQASTASDFSGTLFPASTSGLSAFAAGLSGFTTYFFEVGASTNGYLSGFTNLGSTMTLPAPPGPAASTFTAVQITSVTVAWTSGGNGPGIRYLVQASTASNFTGTLVSSNTANTSASLVTLSSNTAYYFEVQSQGGGKTSGFVNLGSTQTLPAAPVVAPPTFTMVAVTSATVQWGADGNPVGTQYNVQASTASNFSGTLLTSSTLNTSATVIGLSTNTVYYFQVQAQGSSSLSAFVSLGSTQTAVAVPIVAAPTFIMVGVASATVQWGADGNPAGVQFNLQASTASDFSGTLVTSNTLNASATVIGLSTNTVYYFQVQAQGSASVSSFLSLGSTQTLVSIPVLSVPAFTMVGITSATVQWGINGNPSGTQYNVQASTASNFSGTLVSSVTANASAIVIGLSTNTVYYFQVQAQGSGSVSSFLNLGSPQTLVSVPVLSVPTFQMVGVTSATVQWGINGNPSGTQYNVQASTASNFSGTLVSSVTANASATLSLSTNTLYYFEVRSQGTGSNSGFLNLGSTQTLPARPAALTPAFTMIGITSATIQWGAGGNPAGTQYVVQASTASDFSGTVKSSTTANVSATLIGLSTAAVYYFQVDALGAGTSSPFLTLGSTQTLVPQPSLVAPAFTMVSVSSVTAQWGAGGNPAGTAYTLVASDRPDFDVNLSNIYVTSATANLFATATNLFANTTIYFEVNATLAGGPVSAYTFLGSTATLAPPPSAGNLFYLRSTISDLPGFNVLTATQAPTSGTDSVASVTTTGPSDSLVAQFVTPAVSTGTLKGGTWTFGLWGNTSNTTSNSSFRVVVDLQHTDGTITQYMTSLYGPVLSASKSLYTWSLSASAVSVSTSDRLGIYVYSASASGKTQKSGYVTTLDYDSTAASSTVKMPFDIVAPAQVANLTGATGGVSQVNLIWNAPGNDGTFGNLVAGGFYFVDYSTYAAAFNINDPQVVNVAISGASPGSAQNTTIGGLYGGTTYYFGIWTQDESGNLSAVSNTTSAVAGRPAAPSPLVPAIASVFVSSVAAQWTNGGNPGGTIYNLQASTASDFSGTVFSSSTSNTFATVAGLAGGTSYYLDVDAVIGLSSSVYSTLGSTVTLPPRATVATTAVAPTTANQGAKTALFQFIVQPGAAAANGVQWSSITVQFTDPNLNPLTNAQAAVLFSSISIIADSLASPATGVYLFKTDTSVVANANAFNLDGTGRQTLAVSTAAPTAAFIAAGQSQIYYLVVQWTSNAAAQASNTIRAAVTANTGIQLVDPVTRVVPVIDTAGTVTTSSTTAIVPAASLAGWPATLGTSTVSVEGDFVFATNSGVEYAGTDANSVVALNTNGTIAWTFPTSYPVKTSPSDSCEGAGCNCDGVTPPLCPDYVYFADAGGNVYKIRDNGASATQIWGRALPGAANIVTSPIVVGATVYMAAPDGKVHALNSSTGLDISGWGYNTPGAVAFTATPYIDVWDTGINSMFIGGQGGQMYRISAVDGSVPSSYGGAANIYATANLDAGLFGSNNSYVLYWGADDGILRVRTSSNLTAVPSGWADFTANPAAPIRSSPYLNHNSKTLYFGCNNGKVYALNGTTGAKIWEFQTNAPVYTTPIFLQGAWTGAGADYVYFGSDDGNVYAVTAANGVLKSDYPVNLGGAVRSGPIYDGGTNTITVGTLAGQVARISAN